MKLKNVTIHKYKSFESDQSFDLDDEITILVGMNESGKTSALEAIAKTNYFLDDRAFKFNTTHDYPRKEKKKLDKSGGVVEAIKCRYEIKNDTLAYVEEKMGKGIFKSKFISISTTYENTKIVGISVDFKKFIDYITKKIGISSDSLNKKLLSVKNSRDLTNLLKDYTNEKHVEGLKSLSPYFENKFNWTQDPIGEYVYRIYLKDKLPKFLYYDEYYSLPSRISIEKLKSNTLDESEDKTAKALFELADINIDDIISSDSFEDYIAELEATEAIISEELFKYWKTNKNLSITFQIDKKEEIDNYNNKRIVEHILDIRVKSKGVSLPLKNRSKGFNWFFSFLVWFKKIQESRTSNYILLMDEPGLNLHASAQADLLHFIEDLSKNYQIVYTTHSPFMIDSSNLQRVRTVLETDKGSVISNSVQEKDPNTLFPLQAALGYDIAQNLFISKKNLLVEGVSDLVILTALSGVLESLDREGLKNDITIVPTGGLEKVATFISLLRGSQLEIVCLLDSYNDPKGEAKMNDLISQKIIQKNRIHFFDEFLDSYEKADLEDLFLKQDYVNLFNKAFPEYDDIILSNLNSNINQIIIQINNYLKISRFNHYRVASELIKQQNMVEMLSEGTLNNFEQVFKKINRLF